MSNSEKEIAAQTARDNEMASVLASPMMTTDMVVQTAPSFAVASLMISSAQAQARALEASTAHLNQSYMVSLSTATQCVTRILDTPSQQLTLLNAALAASRT